MSGSNSGGLLEKLVLTAGWLALAGAVAVAHATPATGYEVSIYTATPAAFWALFGVAMGVSLLVALGTAADWLRRLALGLGGAAAVAFAGLPVLRGYRFFSGGDALTHLGWARGLRAGAIQPTELNYPGLHTVSTLLATTVGIDLAQAMLVVIALLCGLFFLFVSLSTSVVVESRYSTTVGAFAAFLLLPITNLSTFTTPHPMSQAILFASVVVYLLLTYVRSRTETRTVSGLGSLLALASVALVLYHPQLVAHLLAVFVGIGVVQFLARRYRTSHPIAAHRPIYGQTVVLVAAFLAWSSNHGFFRDVISFHVWSALEYVIGGGGPSGESVDSKGASLAEIGASFLEVVLKLLGPSLVFAALVGLFVLWAFLDDGTTTRETDGVLPYFVVAIGGLSVVFVVYFFGSVGDLYFRVFGLVMLFVTVGGAAALAYGTEALSRTRLAPLAHGVLVVGIGILLVASLLAVFPSPYIYSASPHVTEQSMAGHEHAFEYQDEDVSFVGIRAGPNRYADAVRGELDRTRAHGAIEAEEIDDGIARQYDGDRYLSVDQQDRDREVIAYRELRYSEAHFDAISAQAEVDRVQSNGEFEVYFVRGTSE